jgi:hypothetical protein
MIIKDLKSKDTTEKETYQLTYEEAIKQIQTAKRAHGNSDLFGHETSMPPIGDTQGHDYAPQFV